MPRLPPPESLNDSGKQAWNERVDRVSDDRLLTLHRYCVLHQAWSIAAGELARLTSTAYTPGGPSERPTLREVPQVATVLRLSAALERLEVVLGRSSPGLFTGSP